MAEEKDTSSSLLLKLAVTESSEVPSELETNSGSKMSKSEDDGDKEGEITEEMQMQTVDNVQHILDDLSEDDDDEDDTNLVVLDPNHVRGRSIRLYPCDVRIPESVAIDGTSSSCLKIPTNTTKRKTRN